MDESHDIERYVVSVVYHHGRWWPRITLDSALELKYIGGQSRNRMKALRNGAKIAVSQVFDSAQHAAIEIDARPTRHEE